MLCLHGQLRNTSVLTHFIHFSSTASVLKLKTEPFRNALAKTRNWVSEMRNCLGTLLVLVQSVSKWRAVSSLVLLNKISRILLQYSYVVWWTIIMFPSYGKPSDLSVYTDIYCVGAGINTLMFISNRLGSYMFFAKMEKTWPMREEMDGKVFISRQNGHFIFIVNMIKVLFPICTLTWCVNNFVSRRGKDIHRKNERSIF